MNKILVLNKASLEEINIVHPYFSKIIVINKLLLPYKEREYKLKDVKAEIVKIPDGLENIKLNIAIKRFGKESIVLSKDLGINIDSNFIISCLIRALDIFTIKHGCDLRLNEVLIADAENILGKICFRYLLNFARRIILLADKRENLIKDMEFALKNYGISVAVIEDPIKAASLCKAMIITDKRYEILIDPKKPTLLLNKTICHNGLCFDDVDITLDEKNFYDSILAQGFLEMKGYERIWKNAEEEGFKISKFKLQNNLIMEI